jgi:hypothetical protein
MKVKTLRMDLSNDNITLERLNEGGLLYPMNMSFHRMCCSLQKLEKCVYVGTKNIQSITNNFNNLIDAPPNSLIDSITSPKVKTMEG